MLSFSALAYAQGAPCTAAGTVNTFGLNCVFYSGAFSPNDSNANALANENDAIVGGSPYGAATFQNFNWGGGQIDGLFTNNLSGLNPTSGYWEIRSGVSEGNGGGPPVASGTGFGANFRHTATLNGGFGYQEYTDAVLTPGLNLAAGKYWLSVVPNDPNNPSRSFNTNTPVSGGQIGTDNDNEQYFDGAFFGANFTNANNQGIFPNFSSGVLSSAPEPSSLIMLGSGVLGLGGLLRRRLIG